MPREEFHDRSFLNRSEILSFEEIYRLSAQFVSFGVSKIRITGGEPLLRRELPQLIEMLSSLGVDLALTTNAVRLPRNACALRAAGLSRLTVSLDALDDRVFQEICDAPGVQVDDVLRGIHAAERAGFGSVKVNCVVRRGHNDDQIEPLARHFAGSGHILRFIEYMDVGAVNGWTQSDVVPASEILEHLAPLGDIEELPPSAPSEVAKRYRVGGVLEVGLINSISAPFCGDCSRVRLSADGGLYTCLFSARGHDLKKVLRSGADDTQIRHEIARIWQERTDRYSERRKDFFSNRVSDHDGARHLEVLDRVEMSFIGG